MSVAIIGFDSAWTDAVRAPGAVAALIAGADGFHFQPPRLAGFDAALAFVREVEARAAFTLVALDQPTIVPNVSGSRPVERVAASVVSFVGGGVQPSNRSKVGMFDDAAPVWRFKAQLSATEEPEAARSALLGLHLIEVFPALALAGLADRFGARFGAPKYNPANRSRFRLTDWTAVCDVVGTTAAALELGPIAAWVAEQGAIAAPKKADQDRLDAVICVLIGAMWRFSPREQCVMIGDLATGYMVTPVSAATRTRLAAAALGRGVPLL